MVRDPPEVTVTVSRNPSARSRWSADRPAGFVPSI